ncbi:MAG: dehydrogenase (ubiquinone) 30 kDa subunit [Frankiales bacterium]|nr:dehydrogenase (ubiquinone) 30 kDa subunit [Frankiales bacterium]
MTDLLPGARWGRATGRPLADVDPGDWLASATALRDAGHDYFDLLTAVDEQEAGFDVVVHLWSVPGRTSVLLRTRVPRAEPRLDSLAGVFKGAAWHERQAAEMFGIDFHGHPGLDPLLLPDGFDGAPLRKDFVLASRVVRPWPGAPEPGQSSAEAAVGRRKTLPPGVPAPGTWGSP